MRDLRVEEVGPRSWRALVGDVEVGSFAVDASGDATFVCGLEHPVDVERMREAFARAAGADRLARMSAVPAEPER